MTLSAVLISGYSAGWNILKLIVMVILVLVLAFYSTKFIAKFQNNTLSAKSNIRFLESYHVGNNKLVAIAKIGERYFALGIGKDEIHVISELQPEDLKLSDYISQQPDSEYSEEKRSFKDILSGIKSNHTNDNGEE